MVSFLIAFYNFHLSSIVENTIFLIDMPFCKYFLCGINGI